MTEQRATIRSATHADESAVYELAAGMATTFAVDRDTFQASFRSLVDAEDSVLLVAEISERVSGYALAFTHLAFFANGPVAWVEEIAVQPELRRQRLGALLMEEVERRASAAGVILVALATRRAAEFYSAIGYEPSATYFRRRMLNPAR